MIYIYLFGHQYLTVSSIDGPDTSAGGKISMCNFLILIHSIPLCVQVETEVSPTSSDHLQSAVTNKNRDNRHEQEQYPSPLPHEQHQYEPLILVSKMPNRGGCV